MNLLRPKICAVVSIGFDVAGFGKALLSPAFAEWVHAAWARHDLGYAIAAAIARDIRSNPTKTLPSLSRSHARVVNGTSITFSDLVKIPAG